MGLETLLVEMRRIYHERWSRLDAVDRNNAELFIAPPSEEVHDMKNCL
jgi:hypothetical protein